MLAIIFLYHVLGAAVLTLLWIRFMQAWPSEAERYSRRTRALLFLPFSKRWENGVQPDDLAPLRAFRRKTALAAAAILAFVYAEAGYYLGGSWAQSILRP
jgi:hypothetical protein